LPTAHNAANLEHPSSGARNAGTGRALPARGRFTKHTVGCRISRGMARIPDATPVRAGSRRPSVVARSGLRWLVPGSSRKHPTLTKGLLVD
jgi:hypothetical protein